MNTSSLRTKMAVLALILTVFVSGAIGYLVALAATSSQDIYLDDLPSTATYTIKPSSDGTSFWAVRYDGKQLWTSTDDESTIQSAINQTNSDGGGIVYVQQGTYSATVTVKDGVLLILEDGVSGITYTVNAGGYCVYYNNGYAWFEHPINMTGHEIKCGVFDTGTTEPSSPAQGQWWYDTNVYNLKIYNGTDWATVQGAKGDTGAAGTLEGEQPYSYLIFENSTATYMINGTTAVIDDYSTNDEDIINYAIGNTTAGGTVRLKDGTYLISADIFLDVNYVWLEGEGWGTVLQADANNIDVIQIGSDGSLMTGVGIRNLKITCASGVTGVTGVRQWRTWYGVFENILITGSSSADRLRYGWYTEGEADGDHSWDCDFKTLKILNFYDVGWYIEDWEDTQIVNVNIGTENAGATACLYWETPHAGGNAGGSGVFVSNFHWWGNPSTHDTTYGVYISGAEDGAFRSKWSNFYGGDCQYGLYLESADACYHTFSVVHISTCDVARITDNGVGNVFLGVRYGNTPSENYGTDSLASGQTTDTFNHGIYTTPTHVEISWQEDIGDKQWWWSATSTQITVTISASAGQDYSYSWHAIKIP